MKPSLGPTTVTSDPHSEFETITEAHLRGSVVYLIASSDVTESSIRAIPYTDVYRGRTSVMETPAEYLQKASEDEDRRRARLKGASS